jgi:hypothetical protein
VPRAIATQYFLKFGCNGELKSFTKFVDSHSSLCYIGPQAPHTVFVPLIRIAEMPAEIHAEMPAEKPGA